MRIELTERSFVLSPDRPSSSTSTSSTRATPSTASPRASSARHRLGRVDAGTARPLPRDERSHPTPHNASARVPCRRSHRDCRGDVVGEPTRRRVRRHRAVGRAGHESVDDARAGRRRRQVQRQVHDHDENAGNTPVSLCRSQAPTPNEPSGSGSSRRRSRCPRARPSARPSTYEASGASSVGGDRAPDHDPRRHRQGAARSRRHVLAEAGRLARPADDRRARRRRRAVGVRVLVRTQQGALA